MGVHPSIPSNPDIANVFFRAGFIESWGRGIQLIMSASEEYGLPKPEFSFDFEGLRIEFKQNREKLSVISPESPFWALLSHLYSNNKQNEISPQEAETINSIIQKLEAKSLKIITALEEKTHLKRKDLMEYIQLANNTTNAKRYLEPLLNLGIVKRTLRERPNSIYQEYILSNLGKKVAFVLAELLKQTNERFGS